MSAQVARPHLPGNDDEKMNLIDKDVNVTSEILSNIKPQDLGDENRVKLVLKCCLNLKSRGQPIPEQFADKSLIVKCLTSSDETLRLTAFECVCFSRKTTDLVDNTTFEYFLIFYRNSRFTRDPSWQQASIAVMKKLFSRLSASCRSKQK
jgi:hypothetical protein